MRFKEAQKQAAEKGWRLEKLTGDPEATHRYRHYKTGYVVFDGEDCHATLMRHRLPKEDWQSSRFARQTLGDFVLNCLEGDRWIDGFMRR